MAALQGSWRRRGGWLNRWVAGCVAGRAAGAASGHPAVHVHERLQDVAGLFWLARFLARQDSSVAVQCTAARVTVLGRIAALPQSPPSRCRPVALLNLQEREASGQLFKGFFEKSNEVLYDEPEPAAAQQPTQQVDPAAAEAVEEVLRQMERQQQQRASPLQSTGVRLSLVVGLLAVVLAAAARFGLGLGLGRLLPSAWLPLA